MTVRQSAAGIVGEHVLRCVQCGRSYPPTYGAAICPEHAGVGGVLDVEYLQGDGAGAHQGPEAPPRPAANGYVGAAQVEAKGAPRRNAARSSALPEGYLARSPLVEAPRLAAELGIARLLVKDEGRNPTGSLKDRPSALAAELALAQGYEVVACASTGNAAASLAGACATVGLVARIFVPARTPVAKLGQLAAFGARVVLVEGTYDEAWSLCEAAVQEFGWYDRNSAINPYLIEGKKTCAHEIAEDLNGEPVDWVSVSVGDGCTVSALFKGLVEMEQANVLAAVPRLLAVQPAGAAPIVQAFNRGVEEVEATVPRTLADSISVGSPRNAVKALRAVRKSGGTALAVTDEEIVAAQRDLARLGGVYAEPGAAAGIAGIRRARRDGVVEAGAHVVHVVTGSGLKSPTAVENLDSYPRIEPSLTVLKAALESELP